MAEVKNAVEIKNLTKLYGKNKALKNISFDVKRGEILGFLGPNGAGKSTTMNIICGCISANEGSASVCGYDVLENPRIVKSKIGYLPEQPPLYFDMTVIEYLNFVYELKNVKLNKKQHIEDVMKLVQIDDIKKRMIRNLSKGYKQRVGLAQALIGDPEVLILDEPTVGLDPKQIIEIRKVIKQLGKNKTVILSTHILQEVEAVCDSVVIISNGKIVAQNTLEGLAEETGGKGKYVITLLGNAQEAQYALNSMQEIVSVKGMKLGKGSGQFLIEEMPGCDLRQIMTSRMAEKGFQIAEFRSGALTLEETFIKLTNEAYGDEDENEDKKTKGGKK